MFSSPEHFILFHSRGFSRICSSCVFLLLLWLLFGNGRSVLGCAKRDVVMPAVLKMISLTDVCSSFAVAVPCFVGVDVVAGSQSNSISVSAKAKCEHYIGEVDCCEYRAMVVLAL